MAIDEINDIQDSIIDDFSFLDSWDEKYSLIIDLGKQLPSLSEKHKTGVNRIKGCQSQVWLIANTQDNKVYYEADSDAIITKGLIALLLQVFSGKSAENIIHSEPYFIEKIGMHQHLSPTRSNGLASMVKQIKLYALALQAKSPNL
jgi:cysteine desulfuration protein SufE